MQTHQLHGHGALVRLTGPCVTSEAGRPRRRGAVWGRGSRRPETSSEQPTSVLLNKGIVKFLIEIFEQKLLPCPRQSAGFTF